MLFPQFSITPNFRLWNVWSPDTSNMYISDNLENDEWGILGSIMNFFNSEISHYLLRMSWTMPNVISMRINIWVISLDPLAYLICYADTPLTSGIHPKDSLSTAFNRWIRLKINFILIHCALSYYITCLYQIRITVCLV